jgi:hypothetical protein
VILRSRVRASLSPFSYIGNELSYKVSSPNNNKPFSPSRSWIENRSIFVVFDKTDFKNQSIFCKIGFCSISWINHFLSQMQREDKPQRNPCARPIRQHETKTWMRRHPSQSQNRRRKWRPRRSTSASPPSRAPCVSQPPRRRGFPTPAARSSASPRRTCVSSPSASVRYPAATSQALELPVNAYAYQLPKIKKNLCSKATEGSSCTTSSTSPGQSKSRNSTTVSPLETNSSTRPNCLLFCFRR